MVVLFEIQVLQNGWFYILIVHLRKVSTLIPGWCQFEGTTPSNDGISSKQVCPSTNHRFHMEKKSGCSAPWLICHTCWFMNFTMIPEHGQTHLPDPGNTHDLMICFCGILLIVVPYLVVPGIGGIFFQGQFLAFSWDRGRVLCEARVGWDETPNLGEWTDIWILNVILWNCRTSWSPCTAKWVFIKRNWKWCHLKRSPNKMNWRSWDECIMNPNQYGRPEQESWLQTDLVCCVVREGALKPVSCGDLRPRPPIKCTVAPLTRCFSEK